MQEGVGPLCMPAFSHEDLSLSVRQALFHLCRLSEAGETPVPSSIGPYKTR